MKPSALRIPIRRVAAPTAPLTTMRFRLSEATVKTHVARILSKLRLRDRAQAVIAAYETGLVTPGSDSRGPAGSQ